MTDVEKSEISPHVKKFQHDTIGVISDFSTWHVCDVENVSTCVQFMLFCCKIGFVAIYGLLSRNLLCTFVWRKIEPKIASVEKK